MKINKYIYFDVGARDGNKSFNVARSNRKSIVYGFEPNPLSNSILEKKIVDVKNYILIKCAVSDFNGNAKFNISGKKFCWGCSSLLEFSDKAKTEWGNRTDTQTTQTINVEVIRLDTFIEQNNISKIDYLHIDAQGSDLKVLCGLGEYINILKEGVLEAANKKDILYIGQNTKEECINFLEHNNFIITKIKKNDEEGNEVNIYFRKK